MCFAMRSSKTHDLVRSRCSNANGEGQLPLEKLHNGVIAGLRRSNSEQFLEAGRSSRPRNCSPR